MIIFLPPVRPYRGMGKNGQILVGPRVKARVSLYGKELKELDLSDLHKIINLHGHAMVKVDNLDVVMPHLNAKQNNVKLYSGTGDDYHGSEFVTALIELHNAPADNKPAERRAFFFLDEKEVRLSTVELENFNLLRSIYNKI